MKSSTTSSTNPLGWKAYSSSDKSVAENHKHRILRSEAHQVLDYRYSYQTKWLGVSAKQFRRILSFHIRGWEYMISHELKCIFVHCQKTAGDSISQAVFGRTDNGYLGHPLLGSPMKHYTARNYIEKYGNDVYENYFTFSCVRNPYDRIISWLKFRDKRLGRANLLSPETIKLELKRPKYKKFSFTKMLFDTHGNLAVDQIIRFESLEKDFEVVRQKLELSTFLPELNKTRHEPYWKYYDEEAKDLVYTIYEDDLKYFGYEFD